MKYLYYTYVDAKTRASCIEAPPSNGPDNPAVPGLLFGFALESRYPTAHPIMYGACPDDAETNLPGVLGVITEAAYQQALADEMTARRSRIVVSKRQARLALLQVGMLDDVESAITAIPDETQRRQALISWEYADTIQRLDPWVASIAPGLGLDDEALDGLFAMAATL